MPRLYLLFWALYGIIFVIAARLFLVNPLITALHHGRIIP